MISSKIPGFGYSSNFLRSTPAAAVPLPKPSSSLPVTHTLPTAPSTTVFPSTPARPKLAPLNAPRQQESPAPTAEQSRDLRSTQAVVDIFRAPKKEKEEALFGPMFHNPYKGMKL